MGVYMGDQRVDEGSGGAGVTLEQVNAAIDEKLVEHKPMQVYSTEETVIGVWVNPDGSKQPLYMSILRLTSPSQTGTSQIVGYVPSNFIIKNLFGAISAPYAYFMLNEYFSSTAFCGAHISKDGRIVMMISEAVNISAPVEMTIEYTKADDTPTS